MTSEKCPQGCECPVCGESRIDWLVWDEWGEHVTCTKCGAVYAPNKGREEANR